MKVFVLLFFFQRGNGYFKYCDQLLKFLKQWASPLGKTDAPRNHWAIEVNVFLKLSVSKYFLLANS